MNVKSKIRTLAGAALVALSVAGVAAIPAGAERNTGGTNDPNCAATGATLYPPTGNDYEFFPPGELVTMRDAKGDVRVMKCGKGGTWTDYKPRISPRGLPGGISVRSIPGRRGR
jgi:hypothetical protein